MEKNKKLKGRYWLNGKLLVRASGLLLALLIVTIFLIIYNLREYKNSVNVESEKIYFNIYDVGLKKISFSRSELNPKPFENYTWLPAGTLEVGGRFLEKWDDQKISSLFEVPGKNPSKYVPEVIQRLNLNTTIEIVDLIKFKISGDQYLYVSLKTSDLANYTQYSLLKKVGNRWVIPSSKLSPVADLSRKAKKISDAIIKEIKSGKIKYSSISSLE